MQDWEVLGLSTVKLKAIGVKKGGRYRPPFFVPIEIIVLACRNPAVFPAGRLELHYGEDD